MKLHQYNFIASPDGQSEVLGWFESLDHSFTKIPTTSGLVLHFPEFGEIKPDSAGKIDGSKSPIVLLNLPVVRRRALWTVGEVKFLPSAISSQFPELHRINKNFKKWMSALPLIFSHQGPNDFDYYLEGGSRNWTQEIYAFDSGLRAIQGGQYFVSHIAEEQSLLALCGQLRARGIPCSES